VIESLFESVNKVGSVHVCYSRANTSTSIVVVQRILPSQTAFQSLAAPWRWQEASPQDTSSFSANNIRATARYWWGPANAQNTRGQEQTFRVASCATEMASSFFTVAVATVLGARKYILPAELSVREGSNATDAHTPTAESERTHTQVCGRVLRKCCQFFKHNFAGLMVVAVALHFLNNLWNEHDASQHARADVSKTNTRTSISCFCTPIDSACSSFICITRQKRNTQFSCVLVATNGNGTKERHARCTRKHTSRARPSKAPSTFDLAAACTTTARNKDRQHGHARHGMSSHSLCML